MSLQHMALKDVDEATLEILVLNAECESKSLEFKADLQIATSPQKQEFLSDVTALANTDGGDLLIGLRATKGIAKELVGLRNFVPDDRLGQLENLLRDSVQPRLMGLEFKVILLKGGTHMLIVRVGRSFAAPHMVRHDGVTRFCGRNSTGKYDLDVQELRSAFIANDTLSDKLRNFRLDRVNKLISGSGAVLLASQHLMVLHLLPLASARSDFRLGISDLSKLADADTPRPMRFQGFSRSHNIDGLLVASSWKEGSLASYVQVYRNGFIESVESEFIGNNNQPGQNGIRSDWELCFLNAFPSYINALQVLGVAPPYVASICLLGVRGYRFFTDPEYFSLKNSADRDNLLTGEILIENPNEKPEKILKPLFDQIWNGFGWPGSVNYGASGERKNKK